MKTSMSSWTIFLKMLSEGGFTMAEAALAYYEDRQDYEVIGGKVYMMARPSVNHWRISHRIIDIFDKRKDLPLLEFPITPIFNIGSFINWS